MTPDMLRVLELVTNARRLVWYEHIEAHLNMWDRRPREAISGLVRLGLLEWIGMTDYVRLPRR